MSTPRTQHQKACGGEAKRSKAASAAHTASISYIYVRYRIQHLQTFSLEHERNSINIRYRTKYLAGAQPLLACCLLLAAPAAGAATAADLYIYILYVLRSMYIPGSDLIYIIYYMYLEVCIYLEAIFWTSRGHRCRPFSPPIRVFIFIAYRCSKHTLS